MEAKAKSFTFLGDEGAVRIPFFQRGYVWNKINWEDMLIDLFDFNKSHFLGSIILQQQTPKSGEPKEVLIIDGQQRLTTLSLLLKALYDSFSDEMKSNCKNELLKYLFYKKEATDKNYKIKIIHSRVDYNFYKQVIGEVVNEKITKLTEEEIININEISHKILQCYKYFIDELKNKSEQDRIELFNKLLNGENKIIVLIDLSNSDNTQAIFDTINSAGVRLSTTDIVKNSIFQKAMELLDKEKVINLYTTYWDSVFSKDEETITFWGTLRTTGRLMRDNSEILLHSIAVVEGIYDPEKHTLFEIADLFKEKISSFDKNKIEIFIKQLSEYACLYRDNIPVFDNNTLFYFSDYGNRLFHVLNVCEISTFHPYILFLIKKYKNNKNLLAKRLKSLEIFVVKRMIIKAEVKSYNKLCKDFISTEDIVESKILEFNDHDIIDNLQSIGNKYASLLLFWIELNRRDKDPKQSVKELKYNYSLEHIMPQKWEEYWSTVPVLDDNGVVITDIEKAKKVRNSKIYSIGNMTLLNEKLNISLRNYPFEKKVNGKDKIKGIRIYSDLSITKDDIVLAFDNDNIVWDEKQILNRTKKLSKEILDIWK